MKLPNLKIPTRDLPLVAIGVSAVLISSILKISFAKYVLIAIFFGILSKESRWTFWGMFILIDGFSAFRVLLRTDRAVLMVDTLVRTTTTIGNSTFGNPAIINNSSIAMIENILASVGGNPVLSNPVVVTVLSVISLCVTVTLWIIIVIMYAGYFLLCLPIFGHAVLMLYVFHRDVLKDMIDMTLYSTYTAASFPEMARVITPYILQGIVIQVLLMTAILPLIFYKILKRIGFYKRIPGIQN